MSEKMFMGFDYVLLFPTKVWGRCSEVFTIPKSAILQLVESISMDTKIENEHSD